MRMLPFVEKPSAIDVGGIIIEAYPFAAGSFHAADSHKIKVVSRDSYTEPASDGSIHKVDIVVVRASWPSRAPNRTLTYTVIQTLRSEVEPKDGYSGGMLSWYVSIADISDEFLPVVMRLAADSALPKLVGHIDVDDISDPNLGDIFTDEDNDG